MFYHGLFTDNETIRRLAWDMVVRYISLLMIKLDKYLSDKF